MTNAAKHAQCSQVILDITTTAKEFRFTLKDNGIGFNTATTSKKGLSNIEQRAKAIHADLSIQSGSEGTTILLKGKLDHRS